MFWMPKCKRQMYSHELWLVAGVKIDATQQLHRKIKRKKERKKQTNKIQSINLQDSSDYFGQCKSKVQSMEEYRMNAMHRDNQPHSWAKPNPSNSYNIILGTMISCRTLNQLCSFDSNQFDSFHVFINDVTCFNICNKCNKTENAQPASQFSHVHFANVPQTHYCANILFTFIIPTEYSV